MEIENLYCANHSRISAVPTVSAKALVSGGRYGGGAGKKSTSSSMSTWSILEAGCLSAEVAEVWPDKGHKVSEVIQDARWLKNPRRTVADSFKEGLPITRSTSSAR